MIEKLESQKIDAEFIEGSMLTARSEVADTLMAYWCKERAVNDCIQGIRDKDLPITEMLKEIRTLSKKQYKLKSKIKKLHAYHVANQ